VALSFSPLPRYGTQALFWVKGEESGIGVPLKRAEGIPIFSIDERENVLRKIAETAPA